MPLALQQVCAIQPRCVHLDQYLPRGGGRHRLGGSALAQVYGQLGEDCPDLEDVPALKRAFEVVQDLIQAGRISAGHDGLGSETLGQLGSRGIEIDGDARAYPKRVLAWHEMFVDRVGGIDVAGVYCTLCGAVVLYETRVGQTLHKLGTSGFLYRSNKLMYDAATQSLWSTLEGEPVIGPLAGTGIRLKSRTVVTTTWGEWRRRHPHTTALALDTGHERDYGEGVAYREYFATDQLMFPVPGHDDRLANKKEVLLPRFGKAGEKPLAISSAFLKQRPLYAGRHGGQDYAVLTDVSGAHRIYALPPDLVLSGYDGRERVTDAQGRVWVQSEAALSLAGEAPLPRLHSHNAFWFGWRAAFPDTQLIGAGRP